MSRMRDEARNAVAENRLQSMTGRLGVIAQYDEISNTATVLISGEQSDAIEDVLEHVMCPVTLGVQTVAPSPGRLCWVVFKNGNYSQPLISHYYNHRYSDYDYGKQTQANNGLPSYLLGM